MRGVVVALFCAAALVSAELNENGCPINPYVDVLKAHPICNKFYQCVQGELLERKCASDLTFNEETQECDYADNVDCGERPVDPESSEESGNDSNADGGSNESENNSKGDSSESNSSSNESGNDSNSNSSSNESGNDNDTNSSSNESGNDSDTNSGNNESGNDSNSVDENGNSNAEEVCARKGSNGVLVAHEDCDKFYKCAYGVPVALLCNSGLLYNIEKEQCDWPENVNCEDRNQGGNGDNDSGNGDDDKEDGEADKEDEQVDTEDEDADKEDEDADKEDEDADKEDGQVDKEDEDADNEEADKEDGDNDSTVGGNSDPSQAHAICAKEDSDSTLIAHENCNQYYVCSNGLPVALDCNPNLVFNPATDACEWPDTVDCGTRRTFTSFNKHYMRN